ncbi:MAG TPA: Na+/H+ antiporter NhaA [Longimicrobiaceae bacterium]
MSTTPRAPVIDAYRTPIQRILSPFQRFAETESSGGIVLILCTAAALAWANSPWAQSYLHLWETEVALEVGAWRVTHSLHHWINDGLMAVFFFLVGLEIKREVLVGELASVKRAALPIAAAMGGMVVPALVYTALNAGGPGAPGWGIPMATDIAFALGVLALLGPRVPLPLKVFLAALAIVDDIGAVVVIAVFYTATVSWTALGVAGLVLAALLAANRLGVRHPGAYLLLGVVMWAAFLKSGVHATVAGVLTAMTIPARTRIDTGQFLERGRALLDDFEDECTQRGGDVLTNAGQQSAIQAMENACEAAQSPLQRIEHDLGPWVAFGIIPLFALANAGLVLTGDLSDALAHPVTLGVLLGLVVGKPVGITLFSWLAVRSGVAARPHGVSWRAIHGVSWLGGIGFTMSLFVTALAFPGGEMVTEAKVGILGASILAGVVGWVLMRGTGRGPRPEGAA